MSSSANAGDAAKQAATRRSVRSLMTKPHPWPRYAITACASSLFVLACRDGRLVLPRPLGGSARRAGACHRDGGVRPGGGSCKLDLGLIFFFRKNAFL